jgi:hypothetical protein
VKKLAKRHKEEQEAKAKVISDKIHILTNSLENSKTELAYLHKARKTLAHEKEIKEKDYSSIKELYDMKDEKFNY